MNSIEVRNMREQEKGGHESPIHGDLLEEVFARTPLIDLANASRVSKSWEFAVSSSLFHLNKIKPWLIIQTQNTTSLDKNITTHAYDPRSSSWIEICHFSNPTRKVSPLHSSGSTLLYELSLEGLSFSVDPLHCIWHRIPPPSVWRVDPIVALVGPNLIVIGGGSSFWDDPVIVEVYDMRASRWSTCQSMPTILKDSAASTWLSVASNQHTMYLMVKTSGITYYFSPKTKAWFGPYYLRPEPSTYHSTIGFAGEELILAGLNGHPENVITLKLWKIKPEKTEFVEIGEIPRDLLEKLMGENPYVLSSITLLTTEDYIYICKTSDPEEIITCELVEGECKWGSVQNLSLNDDSKICKRMVMSCGRVGITDLHMAMNSNNIKFVAKPNLLKPYALI